MSHDELLAALYAISPPRRYSAIGVDTGGGDDCTVIVYRCPPPARTPTPYYPAEEPLRFVTEVAEAELQDKIKHLRAVSFSKLARMLRDGDGHWLYGFA